MTDKHLIWGFSRARSVKLATAAPAKWVRAGACDGVADLGFTGCGDPPAELTDYDLVVGP